MSPQNPNDPELLKKAREATNKILDKYRNIKPSNKSLDSAPEIMPSGEAKEGKNGSSEERQLPLDLTQ